MYKIFKPSCVGVRIIIFYEIPTCIVTIYASSNGCTVHYITYIMRPKGTIKDDRDLLNQTVDTGHGYWILDTQ